MLPRDVHVDPFFRVRANLEARTLLLIRSTLPFPSEKAVDSTFRDLADVANRFPREWRLLIDTRDAPLRNDRAFESALVRARALVSDRFSRSAVLVHTAAGKLQVSRYASQAPLSPRVFDDEPDALSFLTAP